MNPDDLMWVADTPMARPAITLTDEQFRLLLAQYGNAQAPAQPTSAPHFVRKEMVAGPVAWSDLPSLDTTKPSGVDAWFLKFESRMKAAQVAVSLWAEKFEECPRVPQSIKTRLPGEALTDYAATRLWVLKEHGPLNPVGHFRAMIYKVRGETRDTVREELEHLLVLYNRAANDTNVPQWSKFDLIHPFIDAFPAETSRVLSRDLAFALAHEDPFEQLFHRAPQDALSSDSILNVAQEDIQRVKRVRVTDPTQEKLDLLLSRLTAIDQQRPTMLEGGGKPCAGCGGNCRQRNLCPAQGRVCHKCGVANHFSSVCRKQHRYNQGQLPIDRGRFSQEQQPISRNRPFRQGPPRQPPP